MYYVQVIYNMYIFTYLYIFSFLDLVVDLLSSHHWTQMEKL